MLSWMCAYAGSVSNHFVKGHNTKSTQDASFVAGPTKQAVARDVPTTLNPPAAKNKKERALEQNGKRPAHRSGGRKLPW